MPTLPVRSQEMFEVGGKEKTKQHRPHFCHKFGNKLLVRVVEIEYSVLTRFARLEPSTTAIEDVLEQKPNLSPSSQWQYEDRAQRAEIHSQIGPLVQSQ